MEPHPRYEILGVIASGDFATVYRGRDVELGRDVAVKQIHPQFLHDPRQLELYWREAQLLAALQHPNVMTIYDIVRSRGWLILELMKGNLQQRSAGHPLDLDELRAALTGCLQALAYLHTNHVTHGDVKPSNILLDKRNQVKLGDFGLARRASNDHGSLLKGTTRYMAPEMVSQQFGPIGPASDLYSLGFSAYELMCGQEQFELLFPGLEAFGRDKQIAWMMWHAAPDRRLPDIARVLEGVPPDLAQVIQKLCQKNPQLRYRTAAEALADLSSRVDVIKSNDEEEAAKAAEVARKAKRKRRLTIAAFVMSVTLSLAAAFWPEAPKPQKPVKPADVRGLVTQVNPDSKMFVIEVQPEGVPKDVVLGTEDKVYINERERFLRELVPDDQVIIKTEINKLGQHFKHVFASRPRKDKGKILDVKADEGTFSMKSDGTGEELLMTLPSTVKILFNDNPEYDGKAVELADLKKDDRIQVEHFQDEQDHMVRALSVTRIVGDKGVIREINTKKHELTIAKSTADNAPLQVYQYADRCEVSLNGRRIVASRTLTPADLKPGDVVAIEHDTKLTRIDAQRVFQESGVVRNIRHDVRTLEIESGADKSLTTLVVPQDCEITLGGVKIPFDDLRRGDEVQIMHDSPDEKNLVVKQLSAVRPADASKWFVIIAQHSFDDPKISPLPFAESDAELLRTKLAERYAIPLDQVVMLVDQSSLRLEQALAAVGERVGQAEQLVVYVLGHAYTDDAGKVYVAGKDFRLDQIQAVGLPLSKLVTQVDEMGAKDKLLILDLCHTGKGDDLQREPATSEMVDTIVGTRSKPGFRTMNILASCDKGQRGLDLSDRKHGLLGWLVAEAYAGGADRDRNNYVERTELTDFLNSALPSLRGAAGGVQTPKLYLPDTRPPRLPDDAKEAIRRLSALLGNTTLKPDDLRAQYEMTQDVSGKEPEPKLILGLILLKLKQHTDSLKAMDEVKASHPQLLPPWETNAWNRFEKFDYTGGTRDLVELITRYPQVKDGAPLPENAERIFKQAGKLREFAAIAVQPEKKPSASLLNELDKAVAAHGPAAQKFYTEGREESRMVAAGHDKKMADAAADDLPSLQLDKRQLRHYGKFDYNAVLEDILALLKNED